MRIFCLVLLLLGLAMRLLTLEKKSIQFCPGVARLVQGVTLTGEQQASFQALRPNSRPS